MDYFKLEKYGITKIKKSFFVEAGANDGITNSISFLLERKNGWSGILIDPVKSNIENCIKIRSKQNKYVHGALVSSDYNQKTIKGNFNLNTGEDSAKSKVETLINKWPPLNNSKATTEVNAYKFKEIYTGKIDLFILDVEGYELEVLKGIDFTISPSYFIVEIRKDFNLLPIAKLLYSNGYKCIADLDSILTNSTCNLLFKKLDNKSYDLDQDILKYDWSFLINNSITIKTGENNDLKNNITINDIKKFFKINQVFKTSRGDYIVEKKDYENKEIKIKDKIIEVELTTKFY